MIIPLSIPMDNTCRLTNAALPYVKTIAEEGITKAVQEDPIIKNALNTYGGRYDGRIVNKALAKSLGFETI